MYRLDSYELVRRSVIVGGMSKRAAAREFGVNRRSVDKMVGSASPPGYVLRSARKKWVLGDFMEKIEEIVLKDQLGAPAKQTQYDEGSILCQDRIRARSRSHFSLSQAHKSESRFSGSYGGKTNSASASVHSRH